MLTFFKRLILVVLILFAVAQLFRPAKTNPSTDPASEIGAFLPLDPAVHSTLARSCNDCHSNRTVWPWYTNVAPASWLVVSDVNRGRSALNFSNWAGYPPADQRKRLSEICNEMREGEMPGRAYLLLHRHAAITPSDTDAVCRWTAGQGTVAESRE